MPHVGLVLDVEFHAAAERRRAAGEPGEQWTMFLLDPAGNALELTAFRDPAEPFAT